MNKVTKSEFFKELELAGNNNYDPVPSKIYKDNDWRCQKTRKLFGRVINRDWIINKENQYFLNKDFYK